MILTKNGNILVHEASTGAHLSTQKVNAIAISGMVFIDSSGDVFKIGCSDLIAALEKISITLAFRIAIRFEIPITE